MATGVNGRPYSAITTFEYSGVRAHQRQSMFPKPRIRQQALYPLMKRLGHALRRWLGWRPGKGQKLHLVSLNGQRFKRLTFMDAYQPARIEESLARFGASDHLPGVVARRANELWVDFVEGDPVSMPDADNLGKLADLYACLYAREPRLRALEDTHLVPDLQRDLRFLRQTGVIAGDAYRDLETAVSRLAPARVWIGFDFIDSVQKNFIIRHDCGRACAIDVESLRDEGLIGTGVAKACMRWLHPHRREFLAHLDRPDVPDFQSYLPFVELCAIASWTKFMFLERKWKHVDPSLFEPYRRAH